MNRPRLSRPMLLVLTLALAALVATGCGERSSSGGDGDTGKDEQRPKLGLDHKVACKVYDEELTTAFIKARIDDTLDYGESLDPEVDYEDLEIDDYDNDDVSPLEANHLDYHIQNLIIAHEAEEAGIEVSDDDVEDRIEESADTAAEARGDEDDEDEQKLEDFYDEQEDQYSLDEESVERLYRNILIEEELTEAIEDDELDEEYDDFDEFREEARERAEDHVDCGEDFEWDPDFDYSFAEDDTTETTSTTETTETTSEEPAVDQAEAFRVDYIRKASPRLVQFEQVAKRLATVINKLNTNKISVKSTIGGFKRQKADMARALKLAKATRTKDPYLQRNHRNLVNAIDAFDEALSHLVNLGKQNSTAGINRELKAATRLLARSDKHLIAWQRGLQNDPEGRDFTQLTDSVVKTQRQIEAIL